MMDFNASVYCIFWNSYFFCEKSEKKWFFWEFLSVLNCCEHHFFLCFWKNNLVYKTLDIKGKFDANYQDLERFLSVFWVFFVMSSLGFHFSDFWSFFYTISVQWDFVNFCQKRWKNLKNHDFSVFLPLSKIYKQQKDSNFVPKTKNVFGSDL